MTYPPYLREKARELRRERNCTIDEIAERLAIGRTTVFYWVGDMSRPARATLTRIFELCVRSGDENST
jgi:transcriptional regulator with XRE-family HTH domain